MHSLFDQLLVTTMKLFSENVSLIIIVDKDVITCSLHADSSVTGHGMAIIHQSCQQVMVRCCFTNTIYFF